CFDELRLRNRADDLLLHLTAGEEDQVRDAADAVPRRSARVLVDVHLHDLQLARVLLRELLDDGRDGPARSAPGGPEIDQDGGAVLEHLALESVIGNRQYARHSSSLPPGRYQRDVDEKRTCQSRRSRSTSKRTVRLSPPLISIRRSRMLAPRARTAIVWDPSGRASQRESRDSA